MKKKIVAMLTVAMLVVTALPSNLVKAEVVPVEDIIGVESVNEFTNSYCEVDGIAWNYQIDENNSAVNVVLNDNTQMQSEGTITKITVPSILEGRKVISIGDSAFYGCDGLKSITLPETLTSIGAAAFYYCESLTNITIPQGVISIGGGCIF